MFAITYYALDLERRELERTLAEIETSEIGEMLTGKVETKGMWGTYNDCLKFIKDCGLLNKRFIDGYSRNTLPTSSSCTSTEVSKSLDSDSPPTSPEGIVQLPLHIIFLGSSLGNFPTREDTVDFLRSLPLRPGSGDNLLLGLDHDNDKEKIEEAYNDSKGYTARFILNALRAAGRALGAQNMFDEDKWDYVNHYDIVRSTPRRLYLSDSNPLQAQRECSFFVLSTFGSYDILFPGRHEAFFKSKCEHTIHDPSRGKDITFLQGELMKIEQSFKVSRNV